jgi:hypothetical protein
MTKVSPILKLRVTVKRLRAELSDMTEKRDFAAKYGERMSAEAETMAEALKIVCREMAKRESRISP